MTKRVLMDIGFAIDTDDPEETKKVLVRALNNVLYTEPELKWMGGPVAVANITTREITPKMMELAQALVDDKLRKAGQLEEIEKIEEAQPKPKQLYDEPRTGNPVPLTSREQAD